MNIKETISLREWTSWAKQDSIKTALLLVAAIFYSLGFIHLRADFPNHSPWMDWAKMTDEGWYGGAAAHHFAWGHWYLPDSFNPAVVMPLWPAMLGAWFELTGVGMVAARTLTMLLYGVSLVLLYQIMWRARPGRLASVVVLITAINPFCYAFNRMAILEPAAVLWLMLALWLAGKTAIGEWLRLVLLGFVTFLMIQTKFTALAQVPAVLYLLWGSWGFPAARRANWRAFASILVVLCAAGVLWAGYLWIFVEPHYLVDFKYLFEENQLPLQSSRIPKLALYAIFCLRWINPILVAVGMAIVILSWLWLRELWAVPLFGAAFVAVVGLLVYTVYRVNFQPRYYLTVAMPVTMLVGLGMATLWDRTKLHASNKVEQRLTPVLGLSLLLSLVWMGARTIGYVLHPEYSFWNAAQGIAAIVNAGGSGAPVLLSESGDDFTMWTGMRAVSEQYTPEGLEATENRYRPEWYAAWLKLEDVPITVVSQRYVLREVARYQVFDDPKRQTLVLYKLTPR
jgi:4-amino-4-deoxy-L-arabinose transferase-like glycosyltransferase